MPADQDYTDLMELNALILDSVGDGVYGIDKNGNGTFSNPAAEKMTGWSSKDLIGNNCHQIWHHTKPNGSHYPDHECPIFAALHDGLIHYEQNELFWRKDGSCFPVEYISTPMLREGKIVGAVVVFRDITQRKQQERELQNALLKVKELQEKLQAENTYLREEISESNNSENIIGSHPKLMNVLKEVKQVAPTDATVLINGETGTGKELIARAIHIQSRRHNRPLIKLNCGAIPENLVESELFGHEKGAFTGALHCRPGRFELANGGTLFLDEVAELPADTQTKLLRVLQEQEFERIGSNKSIKVDVRIIAASHKNLAELCEKGEFRQDLFYRLNVFPLYLPALRDRASDIEELTAHILKTLSTKLGKPLSGVTPDSARRMREYPWYGNIRELQNVLERAAILSLRDTLTIDESAIPQTANIKQSNTLRADSCSMLEMEKQHIANVLKTTNWKISGPGGAAEILDMHPNTLRSRMEKLSIIREA